MSLLSLPAATQCSPSSSGKACPSRISMKRLQLQGTAAREGNAWMAVGCHLLLLLCCIPAELYQMACLEFPIFSGMCCQSVIDRAKVGVCA